MQEITCNRRIGDEERLFINIARGVAIFLMIWGHCIQYCCAGSFDFFENAVFKFIYSFHMPLFMLISGYLFWYSFQKRNLGELLVRKTQALLQPIIMCGILSFLMIDICLDVIPNRNIVNLWDGAWLNHIRDFWFLWSVLAASVTLAIAFKITDRISLQLVFTALGIFAVALFPGMIENVYMYPYFVLGFLFAKFRDEGWLEKLAKLRYAFIAIFPVMMLFFKKDHYIYTTGLTGTEGVINHMPENLFRWAIGLAGSIFVLVILELTVKVISNRRKITAPVKFTAKLGEKSLQVYILSCIFVSQYLPRIVKKAVASAGHNALADNMLMYAIFTFILAALFSIGLLMLVKVLERTKISKVLFGK